MKLNTAYKVRKVAGENLILLQGRNGGDLTRVVALNPSALLLWESLQNREFTKDEAVSLLQENYEVDAPTALSDVDKWIGQMRESGLLISE